MTNRIGWTVNTHAPSFYSDLAGNAACMRTENSHQKVAAPCAHQSCNAQHFAATHREIYFFNQVLTRYSGVLNCHVNHFKYDFAEHMLDRWKDVADLASDHTLNHLCLVEIARRIGGYGSPIAQDGNPIAHAKHFLKLVRNIDHSNASIAQPVENAKQVFHFGAR